MCGIAGIVARPDEVVDPADVRRMCQTLIHRGPDDDGFYQSGPVALGIRRLSVIDLLTGHQPIHNEDKSVWVVCNGEIYNFRELRQELQARGHRFSTNSDTEVIVHLYEEMGAECVTKLRGMFGLALYDESRRSLLLARDRVGKKPLFYAQHNGRLIFASEIKAILAAAPELAEVNPEGILQFFYFGYVPDPQSAFRQIEKLPPGHLLEYRAGRVELSKYWDLPAYGAQADIPESEALGELERRLTEAVQLRLASDAPLGVLLSGGVDSSVIVALMARTGTASVKTFSIGFHEQQFDETSHARIVAEHFGTEHHELVVEPKIDDAIEHLTGTLEEPFADSSMLPTFHVCQMAKRHVTVALSGDGGDELFAGYDRYAISLRRRSFDRLPARLGGWYRSKVHDRVPASAYGRNLAWNASLSQRDRYLDDVSYLPVLGRERGLFSEDFIEMAGRLPDPWRKFREYYDCAPAKDHLGRMQYVDTKTYLPGDILTKVDRMSMANSLEVRCPLLDHEVMDWVARLPGDLKLRHGWSKYLLRKLAVRLDVPRAVLDRPKQGFQLPLKDWWKGALREKFVAILLEPRTLQRGYFRADAARKVVDEHLRGRRNRSGVMWQMLMLELWHRNFLERSPRRAALDFAGSVPAIASEPGQPASVPAPRG